MSRSASSPAIASAETLQTLQQMVTDQLSRQRQLQDKKGDFLTSLLVVGSRNSDKATKPAQPARRFSGTQQSSQMGSTAILAAARSTSNPEDYIPAEGFKPNSLSPWSHSASVHTSPSKSPRKKAHHTRKLPSLHPHLQPSQPQGRGLMRAVDILRIDDHGNDVEAHSAGPSAVNEQLVHDVSTAFREMYEHRKPQQVADEDIEFLSRIKTPPELANDDLTAYRSKQLFNELIDDLSISNASLHSQKSLSSRSAALLGDMQAGYQQELSSFSSISLFVEARYLEMKEKEQASGNQPTHAKAAQASDLVMTLTKALGRYQTLMEPLLWELLNSIFVNFAAIETRLPHCKLSHCLADIPTYFDRYREVQSQLEDANTELGILHRGSSMRDVVKRFQTVRLAFDYSSGFIRDACFKAWKSYAYRWRRLRVKARLMALRVRWKTWQLFIAKRHVEALEQYEKDIDARITRVLRYHEEHSKKNTTLGTPFTPTPIKAILPADDKPSSLRKYMQRLSKYVHDLSYPIHRAMDMPSNPPVASPAPVGGMMSTMGLGPRGASLRQPSYGASLLQSAPSSNWLAPVSELGTRSGSPDTTPLDDDDDGKGKVPLLSHQLSRADVHHLVGEDTPHGRLVHDQSVSRWHQLKLSANVCRENMTQTPDDWMMDVPEPVFTPEEIAALRSRQQGATPASHLSSSSGDARLTQELSAVSEDEAMQMSRDDADPPPRPGQPPSTKFSLNVEMAQHLVAFIYESRMVDIASDKSAIDFSEGPPFLEYIKQLFLKRYRIRRLANKFFRGLMSCCLKESAHHRRLELFGNLCGISLMHKVGHAYDHKRITFFFNVLHTLFENDLDLMIATFAHGSVSRQLVIDKLPIIYEAVEKYDGDLYEGILFEIIDLPCVDQLQIDQNYKVNIDEALSTLLEYYDVELEERDAHKLKMRREQEAQDRAKSKNDRRHSSGRDGIRPLLRAPYPINH